MNAARRSRIEFFASHAGYCTPPLRDEEKFMTTKAQLSEQSEAREKLREMLPPGTVVSTIVQHVSRSGMSRSIKCVIAFDGEVRDITGYVALALGAKRDRYWGIKRVGCGMDMAWDLVYCLSRALYSSSDGDGGYVLTQRSL
jgi:hypothetical protein